MSDYEEFHEIANSGSQKVDSRPDYTHVWTKAVTDVRGRL